VIRSFEWSAQFSPTMNRIPLLLLALGLGALVRLPARAAENPPAWDDTRPSGWADAFQPVSIPSSVDGTAQRAMWHASADAKPQPLIVSLHTWSGDFAQNDPLAEATVARGFNYIHPDFRGPNNKPEACGSDLVVADIDDAIDWALSHGNVDRANVHVIGVSGGGHATMLAWMRSRHDVRTFSAWVGISDLVKWYHESVGRDARYATDLCQVTTGDPARFDPAEAEKRSPLFMATPAARRALAGLHLYAGVHDGYTGSVPITQTIDFYNKVVRDLTPANVESLVPAEITEALLRQRTLPADRPGAKRIPGDTIYERSYQDRIHLAIFEGGHEMLVERALDHVPSRTILAIGDSNGAAPDGWVAQLRALRFQDVILNTSISGNTIGFDNLGNPALNTLRNIDAFIESNAGRTGAIDTIVILLGTNDCKAEFDGREAEVRANMDALLAKIRAHPLLQGHPPRLVVVSPPPMGPEEKLAPKYAGGPARVARLVSAWREAAARHGCVFVDIHTPLQPAIAFLSKDGVHLTPEGQSLIAKMIAAAVAE
jgi:lysophospholipase L1-like esterase/dienelactone hydrolase